MRLAFRDIEIDPDRFELTRNGEPVRLEPQAFEVLVHLIRHRDRVVTRDELLEAIWGSVYVSDAALATRIKEARRALGDDGTTQWAIRTIHRRGYRFVVDVEGDAGADGARTPASESSAVPRRIAPEPPAAGGPGPSGGARPPVGRAAEFERLLSLLGDASRGRAQLVFVTGEAGIGKSTLVGEFLAHVAGLEDTLVGRGQCIEGHGAAEAYLPVLDAVGQLASGPRGSVAVRALQQEAPTWLSHLPGLAAGGAEGMDPLLTRDRMLRELVGALGRLGQERCVVLALEDLHWSDPSTLDALEMVGRRQPEARLLVLGTVRTGDALSGSHRVHGLAAELAARGYATLLPLGPLDDAAMQELIAERAGAALPADITATVASRSGGNPLFATSLLEQWTLPGQEGQPAEAGGLPAVPDSLRQLVSRQLEHIPDEHRRVIEAAAVAGDTLTPSIAAAISGLDLEAVEEVLDERARRTQFLRRRGVFEWPDGTLEDEYEFIHSLHRETTLAGLPMGRRARMHRAAGLALSERLGPAAQQHIEEIAAHFVLGGDADRAVPALIQSAYRARSRSAQREAREALERAIALLPRVSDEDARNELEVEAQTLLGAVIIALDGWAAPSIQSAYERALDLCRVTNDQARIREILSGLATTHEFRGEYEESQRLIMEQIAMIPPGRPAPPESHELLACSLFHQGLLRRSVEEATAGLEIVRAHQGIPFRTAFGEHPETACLMWIAQSRWFLGEVRQAFDDVREAIESAPDDLSLLHAHYHAGMIQQYSGDIAQTREHARRMFALAQTLGFESHQQASALLRAWAEAADGVEHALPLMERAVDAYRSSGLRMDLPWVLAVYADALVRWGRVDEAEQALDEAFAIRDPGRGYIYEPEMWRLRGRIAEQRQERAVEHYRRAVESARAYEAHTLELRALTAALRAGDDTPGLAEEVRALLERLAGDGLERDLDEARAALAST